MDVVFYAVVYVKHKPDIEMVAIHLIPFETKEEAKEYCKKCQDYFKERVVNTKVRRTDLSKSEDGYWI